MNRWRGLLAPINKPTGDGRMFAPGAVTSRDLPLPLRFQRAETQGHSGSVVVGRITKIDVREDGVYGEGDWFDPAVTSEVTEAQQVMSSKVGGPSVDLDDTTIEMVPRDPALVEALAERVESGSCGCDKESLAAEAAEIPMIRLVTAGRLSGATIVAIPAFAECSALELYDADEDVVEQTLTAGGSWAAGDAVLIEGAAVGDDDVTGFFVHFSDDEEWATVVQDDGTVATVASWRLGQASAEEQEAFDTALMAGATPMTPPIDWFTDPGLSGPTPLTVTEDGRVYGHLAEWGVCHVGLPGCTTAPRSGSNYAYFHVGEVLTDDGSSVSVGKLTLGTGHADAAAGFRAAAEHYDNSGAAVAVVRAGEDEHGIWVAGALTPEADDLRVHQLRRSPLSGDWRRIGRDMELVAALAVNVPGFAVPRTRTRIASGRPLSLVAAGVLDPTAPRQETAVVDEQQVEQFVVRVMKRRRKYEELAAQFDTHVRVDRTERAAALLAYIAG